jgi:thiol-disulfide isomerase/thioredoxin
MEGKAQGHEQHPNPPGYYVILHFNHSRYMALTPTKEIPLGFKAPDFALPDVVSGRVLSYEDIKGTHGTLVMFICNHCPYVIHVREQLIQLAQDYQNKGIGFVAISSNDAENYPQDGPDAMKQLAVEENWPFPYLYDESQEVARAYDAACTPDFDLFNSTDLCVYRGQLDESRPGNQKPVDGASMRQAIDLMLQGKYIPAMEQKPSMGCNINWK